MLKYFQFCYSFNFLRDILRTCVLYLAKKDQEKSDATSPRNILIANCKMIPFVWPALHLFYKKTRHLFILIKC